MKRIATIDLGTNTFLFLISELDHNEHIKFIHHEQRIPRIGRSVDEHKNINHDAFVKSAAILNEYKAIAEKYEVSHITATGTSALRDANNKKDFCDFIKNETGIDIEILEGVDEAYWSYRGGLSFLDVKKDAKYSVIDIGGGSTEIVSGKGKEIINRISLNVGSVRLTERFLKHSPPHTEEIESMDRFLQTQYDSVNGFDLNDTLFTGVAGTVTTLAMIDRNEKKIIPQNISGYVLSIDRIEQIFNILKTRSVQEIETEFHVQSGRSDIILAGIYILLSFMKRVHITKITTSITGLRHGIAIREFEKYL